MKKNVIDIKKIKQEPLGIKSTGKKSEEIVQKKTNTFHVRILAYIIIALLFIGVSIYLWFIGVRNVSVDMKELLLSDISQEEKYRGLQEKRKVIQGLLLPLRPVRNIIPIYKEELDTVFLGIDILKNIEEGEDIGIDILKNVFRSQGKVDISAGFDILNKEQNKIRKKYENLCENLEELASNMSSQYIQTIGEGICTSTNTFFTGIQRNTPIWEEILERESVRIMVLNQNKDELRANGGFPGSTFFITLNKGVVSDVEFRDIYALDWGFTSTTQAPEGINKFFATSEKKQPISFYLRDANYYPDFIQSARTINQLLIESGNQPIDILIGIHLGILEGILGSVGDIEINDIVFSEENIGEMLSIIVESKIAKVTSPKDILLEIAEIIQEEVLDNKVEIVRVIIEQIQNGEIVMASTNTSWQQAIDDLGLFDQWKYTKGNYIYPIFTSYSKNKSDRYMYRDFSIQTDPRDICYRVFKLDSFHGYDKITENRILGYMKELGVVQDITTQLFVQGNGPNKQYIRLVVPSGTELISGNATYEQYDTYDILSWYQETRVGGVSNHQLTYTLPKELCEQEVFMYKQPGLDNATYTRINGNTTKTYNF